MDLMTSNLLTDLLDKALECPVCLEQLDVSARVLPCQHTFCRRCLLEIVHSRRELLCPECRVQCDVKVDELPPNILLIRLLEGFKNSRKQSADPNVSQSVNELLGFGSQTTNSGYSSQPMAGVSINQLFNSQQISHSTPNSQSNQSQTQQQQSLVKQLVPTPNLPRAKALYNYDGKELDGDLSFKKGDLIILRKRIDQNWFHGELNGKSGFLPASYVQVLLPPPSPLPPQCKALYDFRVTDVEEKDCLSFAKSDVITVIRRVDENWAEGKLMDRIGIFPISFVEMNTSAKALMKLASINTNTPSRCAPPAPITASPEPTTSGTLLSAQITANTTTTTGASNESSKTSQSSLSHSVANSPQSVLSSLPNSNTSSSKVTNSPVVSVLPVTVSGPVIQSTTLISSVSPTVVPLSTTEQPSSSGSVNSSQRTAENNSNNGINQKRHSMCTVSVSPPGMAPIYQRSQSQVDSNGSQQLRHSMEMLNSCAEEEDRNEWSQQFARTAVIRKSLREQNTNNNDLQNTSSPLTNENTLPVLYVADYNYRPQKLDELELKKEELYWVSEKCHDGWYKGVAVRNGSSGVFPGNYVHLAKSSPSLTPYPCPVNITTTSQSRLNAKPLQQSTQLGKEPPIPKPKPIIQAKPSISLSTTATPSDSSANLNTTQSNTTANSDNAIVYARPRPSGQPFYDISRNLSSLVPPPPPSQRPSRPLSSILVPNTKPNDDPNSPQTQLALALNQSLLISKPQSASQSSLNQSTQWHQPKVAATRNTVSMVSNTVSMHSAVTAITPPPNVSMVSSGSTMTPTSHRPPTDRKESKSKEKSNFIKRFTSSKPKRKHQINNNNNNNNNHNNSHNNSFSCDNPSFVDTSPNSLAPIHIRSGSCPNESLTDLGSHKKQSSFDDSNTVIKNRMAKSSTKESPQPTQPIAPPLVRERFRCVVPYPPNSEYELELQVGDIVYVHKKREDGWFKGTLQRTGKTGLFPGPFVEMF